MARGNVDRRAIAALAGFAPVSRDSGKRSGPRDIEGGRPAIRTIRYYLAGLHASRAASRFRDFRDRLQRAAKAPKAASIATARKLLVTLNANGCCTPEIRCSAAWLTTVADKPGAVHILSHLSSG
jgi:transposase